MRQKFIAPPLEQAFTSKIFSSVGTDPGPGGGSTKFYMGRLRPEVQPLTLLYTIHIPPIEKMVPLSHIYLRTLHSFSNPRNAVNEQHYGRKVLSEKMLAQKTIIYSIHVVAGV